MYIVLGILAGGIEVVLQTSDLAKARRKRDQINADGPHHGAFIVLAVE